jgi:hypothetical protein
VDKVKGIITDKDMVSVVAMDNRTITVNKNAKDIRDKFPYKEITNPPTQPAN